MALGMNHWIALPLWIALCFLPSLTGVVAQPGEWYAGLDKPWFTPPNWLFGPAWTLLYVLMGTAAWLVWREEGFAGAKVALGLFLVQLVLNAAWSPVFFGLHRMGWALVVIVMMAAAILATMVAFYPHSKVAAGLLVPYLGWVSFATALNLALWRLNG